MFKLSVISDEISQDFQRVVDVAREYGATQIEPRSVWDKPPQALTDDDVRRMRDILDAAGMGCACIAAPFLKCDLGNEDQYREHLGILRRCIEIGRVLGTNLVRGFTFWRTGPARDVWGQLLEAYDEPVRILEGEDAYVGIENEASTHIATAREAAALYTDLSERSPAGGERVKAVWDPANEVFADEGELPYPDAFERMKPYLIHVHLKDAVRDENGEPKLVPVGEGGYIDYPAQLQALVDMGYEGACSLETHWRPAEELDENLLDRPGGAAFSASGERASRICFANLQRIVAGLRTA